MLLWVDDDTRSSLKPFIDALEDDGGYEIVMVRTPDEMWEALKKYEAEIQGIIMDIMLPTGSINSAEVKMGITTGLKLLKDLKGNPRYQNIPIVILTIIDESEVIEWAEENNVPYLVKQDTKIKDLLSAVKQAGIPSAE